MWRLHIYRYEEISPHIQIWGDICTYIHIPRVERKRRLAGSLELQLSFAKEPHKRGYILLTTVARRNKACFSFIYIHILQLGSSHIFWDSDYQDSHSMFWNSDYRQRFPLKATEIWRSRKHWFFVLKFFLSPLHSTRGLCTHTHSYPLSHAHSLTCSRTHPHSLKLSHTHPHLHAKL